MFDDKINELEEMMVNFCEYNPMIFAQKAAFCDEKEKEHKTFMYGNFSMQDYLKSYS